MYRPSSHPPETAWARHLDQVRRDRNWSATQLFEYVREPLHLSPKSRSAFVGGLHGDPRPAYLPVLRELFGEPVIEDVERPAKKPDEADLTGLVAALANALQAQAQALTDIRLALAQVARDAESERLAAAALLGHLSDQLDELRELGGMRAGSAAPGSAH